MDSRTVIRGWYLLGVLLALSACAVAAASVLSAEQVLNAALFAGLPLALVAFGGYSLVFRQQIDDFYRRNMADENVWGSFCDGA